MNSFELTLILKSSFIRPYFICPQLIPIFYIVEGQKS